ncbi:efflux RND transporter periplasmic adaptor subunit [Agaribacterium haliotis]|uniref:efflux RND transporter periplasmic adaptor subunit n=1 Tax=Agaribacterium haliotis TaxID=2013869 RepID=UPI000BB57888|nr:efflux RND transporter periplasmic adaptor subunit [Agaribacterium haliotis]
MFKKMLLPAAILGAGLLLSFAVMSTKVEPTADPDQLLEPAKPKVAVKRAVKQSANLSAKSQGSVAAKREVDIVAQVSGQIVDVSPSFVDGRFVDRGEILIKIDDRDYRAALVSAESRLRQKQRLLAEEKGRSRQAKNEWRDLGNREANDLFLRKPQLAEAQAELEAAEADVNIAKLNIERTEIHLPFDARIKETLVNLGQFIAVGTRIASVYDTATAEVRLPLSDRQMALLHLPVSSSDISSRAEVVLSGVIAGQRYQWLGHITRTEASVDTRSRMYHAIAEVEQPFSNQHAAPLLPGLFVEAQISGKKLDGVLVLPKETLVNRANLYTLDKNNTVQLSPVSVLSKHNGQVWLRAELSDDTPILLEKHALLSPGTVVEPVFVSESVAPSENSVELAKRTGDKL